jgi:outer membrane immunogenic protein
MAGRNRRVSKTKHEKTPILLAPIPDKAVPGALLARPLQNGDSISARAEVGSLRTQLFWGISMKKLLIGTVGLLALGSSALAADMAVKARPLPPVVVYNWTGCYIGVNGGWKEGRFREDARTPAGTATIPGLGTTTFAADSIDLDRLHTDSGAVGGQIGCRWETADHWVFGVEGDADWTNLHGTVLERTAGTGRSVFIPGDSFDNRARWEASLRGIVGRSFDKWLLYATGGLAATDVRMSSNFIATTVQGIPFPASSGSESKTLFGWTIGAGAAYAFAPNWDIGAEYRYSQYSGSDFGLGQVAAVCGFSTAVAVGSVTCVNTTATGHKDLRTNEVLLKLNYRFNAGAVVAKY